MTLKKYYKYYEITFWSFYGFFVILFACLVKIHLGLVLGCAIGGLLSYLFGKINAGIAGWVLTTTNKTYRYLFFLFKSFLVFLFLGITLYFVLQIDLIYFARHISNQTLYQKMNKPINVITFIFGLSFNFITIIVLNMFDFYKQKRRKEN
ncbi:hypothetical protein [Mycoplasma hafezii]|uniref:hypothetical protein n=1 Tax=Mycoplasma hafezii TaxID=525886 RepID=UPI003CF7D7B0